MKVKNKFKRSDILPIVNTLIMEHRKFQEFLDIATASNNDVSNIQPLIEIRQFNVDCISKYTDLVSESAMNILPLSLNRNFNFSSFDQNELMWDINRNLSRLIPIYSQALKSKVLNSLTRTIIAINKDRIVKLKDNLLHPIIQAEFTFEGL